jgi:hypothetical protein
MYCTCVDELTVPSPRALGIKACGQNAHIDEECGDAVA